MSKLKNNEKNPVNKDTISSYRSHHWHINTGNFTKECPICGKITKTGDNILIEFDVGSGLDVHTYCDKGCGDLRLTEIINYYKSMLIGG